ncbi:MAG: hypothetical protein ACI97A_001653 [Planctomycetota bacterium]|jgi:hypothetical protein
MNPENKLDSESSQEAQEFSASHDVQRGVVFGFLLHLCGGIYFWNLDPSWFIMLGINQIVYMIPGYFVCKCIGVSPNFIKGLSITGALAFLLTVFACGFLPVDQYFRLH